MPCFHPLVAYYDGNRVQIGASPFIGADRIQLPCGSCDGCRLERSRQWAVRCYHEAQVHRFNSFVTLTYDDAHLPVNGSLRYRDFQLFLKRARRKLGPFRFFMCGEYGAATFRPHYHGCMFGLSFPDLSPIGESGSGEPLYSSCVLSDLWGRGHCSVGHVTFESAAYVARYTLKKQGCDVERLGTVDFSTGELHVKSPEFCRMSLRPAIGRVWWDKFSGDVKRRGDVVVRGRSMRPPRYYDKLLEVEDPVLLEAFKADRLSKVRPEDGTRARLAVQEVCLKSKTKFLKRSL